MAFTDFFIQANGSNKNAGSDTNAAAKYTSTNGNWSTVTNIFTPTDGTNPVSAGVAVGDFASIYLDAAAETVSISRVTAVVNAANGAITVSAVSRAGAVPTTGATGRTIKVGGAWKGMGGASSFPFTLLNLGALVNLNSNPMRVKIKNDQTYTVSAPIIVQGSPEPAQIEGYSDIPNDPNGVVITNGGTAMNPLWGHSVDQTSLIQGLIFISTATTGTGDVLVSGGSSHTYFRCIFIGARGQGLSNGARMSVIECEFYNCVRSNQVGDGCAAADIDSLFLRCYFHDCQSGANCNGITMVGNACQVAVVDCIFDSLQGSGILQATGSGAVIGIKALNCDFYNLGRSGIRWTTAARAMLYAENCNFLKCASYGIEGDWTGGAHVLVGSILNNGFGTGTQANGLGNTFQLFAVQEGGSINYAAGVTPWANPTTGDFRLYLSDSIGKGRGGFAEQALITKAGTIGYPDVGAAAHGTSIIIGGGEGGGGAGAEPVILEVPRTSLKIRDPDISSLIRRARNASRIIENLTIAGAAGNSEDGFSL